MKKLSNFLKVALAVSMVSLTGCDDEETACIGGSGGQLTIVAKLKHHGVIIPNLVGQPDTVWLKYNTNEWGNAPLGYDAMIVGEEGEDHVHIEGLKCGKYYLYGSGYDTTYQMTVRGGIPVNTSQSTGELMIDIPVTE